MAALPRVRARGQPGRGHGRRFQPASPEVWHSVLRPSLLCGRWTEPCGKTELARVGRPIWFAAPGRDQLTHPALAGGLEDAPGQAGHTCSCTHQHPPAGTHRQPLPHDVTRVLSHARTRCSVHTFLLTVLLAYAGPTRTRTSSNTPSCCHTHVARQRHTYPVTWMLQSTLWLVRAACLSTRSDVTPTGQDTVRPLS